MKYIDRLRDYAPKVLIRRNYYVDDLCCALGVCVPALRSFGATLASDEGYTTDKGVRYLALTEKSVEAMLRNADLDVDDAERLQTLNDGLSGTPEVRYKDLMRVLAQVEKGNLTLAGVVERYEATGFGARLLRDIAALEKEPEEDK